jgi:serine/threonine-protein kinase
LETLSTLEQLNQLLEGRYRIEREIGHGGMATVYLAQDVRHERRVALKLLLAELGAILGPERFLSEIRVTANLQHPNLLPLFDSGEAGGRLYYVMPYVEGESLRHRLNREKQLPVDEALRIATACASALDYAHRNDVVHRDLKPENILMSAGQPVIADFGIALAVSNAGGARITQSGLSLGTPQYMSPEQAAGDREIDGRSDIYSLACVLYEMLTGDPPHTGSTVQAVVAKVLVEKPRSVRAQRDRIPEHVDAAIERALAKIPADRWATAGQFAEALSDPAMTAAVRARASDSGVSPYHPRSRMMTTVRRALWPVVALAATAVAAIALWRLRSVPQPKPVTFVVPTPSTAPLAVSPSVVLFVPDGQAIIYAASVAGRRQLFIRRLSEITARPIAGTEDALLPMVSPDGNWVALVAGDDVLYRVPITGGTPVRVAKTPGWRGGTWNRDGQIVFGTVQGLFRTSIAGDEPQQLTTPNSTKGENAHIQPMFLPDGKTILFRVEDRASRANDRLAITSLGDKGYELLGVAGGNPLAVIDGTLFFGRPGGSISAVPFDAGRRKVSGEPVVVLDRVSVWAGAAASFASDGSLAYVQSSNMSQLIVTDQPGALAKSVPGELRRYNAPRLSPDARKVAVEINSAGKNRGDIWVYDIASAVLSRVTSQANSYQPDWSADGRDIIYRRDEGGRSELWRVPADGSGPEERYFAWREPIREFSLSPDGKFAALRFDDLQTRRDIWIMSVDANGVPDKAVPFLTSGFNEMAPRISPDGRWLAYVSDESGREEVYVRPFPGRGARVQVSASGGIQPVWTDGAHIVYRSGDSYITATLATGAGISVTARREVFQRRYSSSGQHPEYDVDRTGKTFVLLQPVGGDDIVVMLNSVRKLLTSAPEGR